MSSGVGLNSNLFFYGVVEDRNDPDLLGRVRVRIVGVHDENTANVPTSDLPWAPIVIPPTSSGNSGLGSSPTGIVEGSWVLVFFADGINRQNPIVLGTMNGFHPTHKTVAAESTKDSKESKNSVGTPKTSASAADVQSATEKTDEVITKTGERTKRLGHISEKYESGGRGPGVISSGKGDFGGKSYGIYQFSLNAGSLRSYIATSKYRSHFASVQLASKEFDSKWKSLAATDEAGFREDQHAYNEKSNFTPCLNRLQFLEYQNRTDAIMEMIWSYATQGGPSKGAKWIKRALNGKNVSDLSDADIIALCYDDRAKNVSVDFKSSSKSVQNSVKNRMEREKGDCLNYCGQKPTEGLTPGSPLPRDSNGEPDVSRAYVDNTPTYERVKGSGGFVDPNGKYPKVGYLGKPSTNRLARNQEINKTIQRIKKLTAINANGFAEPYIFAPQYPYNKVIETESGHVIELDDTPSAERIHFYHKSGSFVEFQPNGDVVQKSVNNNYRIVIKDDNLYVSGNVNVFVEGDAKISALGNISMMSEQNIDVMAQGNLRLLAGGNVSVEANSSVLIGAGSEINETAPLIKRASGSGSPNVKIDIGAKLELEKVVMEEELPEHDDDWDAENNGVNQTFASKKELDENTGYVTEAGEATTSARTINVDKATITPADTSGANGVSEFKGSFKLSPNYVLSDLTTNTAAFKYKLQSQVGLSESDIVKNMMELCSNCLEPIRTRFGRSSFIITSAFRHARGSSKSHHLRGMAADLQFPGNEENIPHIAEEIRRLLPAFSQLIVEYHARNPVIHISFDKNKLTNTVFSTYSSNFAGLRPYGIYDRNQNLIYA